jgi:ArsR family transcriptional regulator, arsenate/arsenite/antimonite-responsive transcriptional repressor
MEAITEAHNAPALAEREVVDALAALAQPVRLRIFRALVVVGPAGLTPGPMAAGLGISSATLSFHLKALMHAGLVTQQRDGRFLIYRAAFGRMNALLAYLTENCCQGAGCAVATVAARAAACTTC